MTDLIDLSKIPASPKGENRVHFRQPLPSDRLDLELGIMKIADLVAEGDAEYADGDLILSARVEGKQRFECSRCLEPVERHFSKDIFLTFALGGQPINALPEIGEEILVDAPINALCREDCRGLCDRCGANLNQAPCGCRNAS